MATSARRDLHVPMTTILKLIGSGFGLWAVWLLWPEFLLFLIAILLAVTLHPAVAWMERRRIARGVSVIVIASFALGLLALFVIFLLPPLTAQMTHLFQDIPAFRARILSRIPARYPAVQAVIGAIFEWSASPKAITVFERSFAWGQSAVSGLVTAAIVFVLTLYLLLDGKSLYAWLLAFVPRTYREKLATTMDEVSDVVHAYVSGQLLVAVLFAIFVAALADDSRRSRGGAAGRDRGRLRRHPGAGHPDRHRSRRLAGARGLARHGGGGGDRVPRLSPAGDVFHPAARLRQQAQDVDAVGAARAAGGRQAAGDHRGRAGAAARGRLPDHRTPLAGRVPATRASSPTTRRSPRPPRAAATSPWTP